MLVQCCGVQLRCRSALRMQVMAAAEYDRDGTMQGGGGAVDVDTGQVRSHGAPAGDTGRVQRAQRKGRKGKDRATSTGKCGGQSGMDGGASDRHHELQGNFSLCIWGCKRAQCPKRAAVEAARSLNKSQQKEEVRG